eukprot:TRINITY_DN7909_c0_g1_i1.p2 TRINITY_DN7909_c0_g1~~TRINITY_DN7909_c0_g1_i1.p2  ORF type:complete len:286 (+),score=-17.96 TRINITY_DN7909_c0_g1_i1:1301-2158(+)
MHAYPNGIEKSLRRQRQCIIKDKRQQFINYHLIQNTVRQQEVFLIFFYILFIFQIFIQIYIKMQLQYTTLYFLCIDYLKIQFYFSIVQQSIQLYLLLILQEFLPKLYLIIYFIIPYLKSFRQKKYFVKCIISSFIFSLISKQCYIQIDYIFQPRNNNFKILSEFVCKFANSLYYLNNLFLFFFYFKTINRANNKHDNKRVFSWLCIKHTFFVGFSYILNILPWFILSDKLVKLEQSVVQKFLRGIEFGCHVCSLQTRFNVLDALQLILQMSIFGGNFTVYYFAFA